MNSTDRFIWVDIETTGLIPEECELLEIAFIVTDVVEFRTLFEQSWVITPGFELTESNVDPFIWDMHTKSGLIKECNNSSLTISQASKDIMDRLQSLEVTRADPLCGSSVAFDRSFLLGHMPSVAAEFSYRNIDISSIKELCKRMNPELYIKLEKYTVKREIHRAIPDLEDTIAEAGFYADNFLILGD